MQKTPHTTYQVKDRHFAMASAPVARRRHGYFRVILAAFMTFLLFNGLSAQADKPADDVGHYQVTWIGNSLPRGAIDNDERSHVQHWIWGIEVSPDGRVYAGGGNESGHAISVFKDGDLESDFIPKADSSDGSWNWGTLNHGAVSFDDNYMYSVNSSGNAHKWRRRPPYDKVRIMTPVGVAANEIVVRFNKMYLVARETGEIQIRKLDDDYTLIHRFTVEGAYDIAVDGEDSIWVSMGGGSHGPGSEKQALNEVRRYDARGKRLPGTIKDFGKLMGIAIGHHQGRLITCDDGPDKQVLFYDISDPAKPVLLRRFGERGGIYSGARGVFDNDLQLFNVQDAGTDAAGNLYVLSSQSGFVHGETGGAMVRAYSAEGEKLWELSSELWTGCAGVLPSTDGQEIYGVEEVFVLDPEADNEKCPADYRHGFCDPDWKLHAITYDDVTNPDDFRVANKFANRAFRGSAEIREIGGKRVIFRQNMYSGTIDRERGYDLLVFEERPSMISHRRGRVPHGGGSGHAWYPDMDGNVWEGNAGGNAIRMHKFGGFDAEGAPVYTEYEEYDHPEWFAEVTRIFYDSKKDVLYLSGYSRESMNDERWPHGRLPTNIAGTHLLRFDDWQAGNRTPSYRIELPWDGSGRSLPPKTWYAAGDYIFTAPVRRKGGVILISVFDANTGQFKGTMSHHDRFGDTGWIDITRGITAFQRSSGEYLVILEDNAYAKNIVYRWTPPEVTYQATGNVGPPITVYRGHDLSYAMSHLRPRVEVIGTRGERDDAGVEWSIPGYDADRPGQYTATGEVILPAGWRGRAAPVTTKVTVHARPELNVARGRPSYPGDGLTDGTTDNLTTVGMGNPMGVDLQSPHPVHKIVMKTTPDWGSRTQRIEIEGKTRRGEWQTLAEEQAYAFRRENDNSVTVYLDGRTVSEVRLRFTSNTRNARGQLHELEVYAPAK